MNIKYFFLQIKVLSLVFVMDIIITNCMVAQGNYMPPNSETVFFSDVALSTSGNWSTNRSAAPGYFTAFGWAAFLNFSDASHINGYVKHIATDVNQGITLPIGSGNDLRLLSISGSLAANRSFAAAWIQGDPSITPDPTAPNDGLHPTTSLGSGITAVSTVGQWDWLDLSNNHAGVSVSVRIPNLTSFGTASSLRLVGWNGFQWINLSGSNGASGNTEDSDLNGTLVAGITALAIGKGISDIDGDGVTSDTDSDDNNPCVPAQSADYTGYVSTNAIWAAADCDGDGVNNGTEYANGSDPYDQDSDDDGVNDGSDPAPNDPCVPNANALVCPTGDFDGDSSTNGIDPAPTDPCVPNANALACPSGDFDGDNSNNGSDPAPSDPCIPNANALACPSGDFDGDGINNGTDTDPSNPCIPNANALACASGDFDGDGVANGSDSAPSNPCIPTQLAGYTAYSSGNAIWTASDCDSDGSSNGQEVTNGTDPYNPDTDGDGTLDGSDSNGVDPCIPNPNVSACGSGDTDGDGVPNSTDPAPSNPCVPAQPVGYIGYVHTNSIWSAADCDGDGLTNGTERTIGSDPYSSDTDGDGVLDGGDSAPTNPCLPNPNALACPSGDTDSDGTPNGTDSQPANPCVPNPNAIACPTGDFDSDGTPNGTDSAPTNPCIPNANALACASGDFDGDGVANGIDPSPMDPCLPAQPTGYTAYNGSNQLWVDADCDSDGVTNGDEVLDGTDPYNGDTDDDGTPDNTDPDGTNPCIPNVNVLVCGIGDYDGDGVSNSSDASPTSPCIPAQPANYDNYVSANSIWAAADCDGDGINNGQEDTNGTDPYNNDSDADGVNDNTDPAPTNPCVPNANALACPTGDFDGDGTPNNTDPNPSNPCIPSSNVVACPTGDYDGDGVVNGSDSNPTSACIPAQNPGYTAYNSANTFWQAEDCDGDGFTNIVEHNAGTDPYNPLSTPISRADIKVFLQGPLNGAGTSMNKVLNTNGLLPVSDPYGLGFTSTTTIMSSNNITDWVIVELRTIPNVTSAPVERIAALVRQDGVLVNADGTLPVRFTSPSGSYYVAVRHRNHIGVMTAAQIALSGTAVSIDFTSSTTATFGHSTSNPSRATVGTSKAMFAGNATGLTLSASDNLKFSGGGSDVAALRAKILATAQPLSGNLPGYHLEDVNMDGFVRYSGTLRDQVLVGLNVVFNNPSNGNQFLNATKFQSF